MKAVFWTVVLLATALVAAGCGGTQTDPPANPGTTQDPTDAATTPPQAEDAAAAKDKGNVPGAVGRALLKAVGGGSESDDPGEAPPFEP